MDRDEARKAGWLAARAFGSSGKSLSDDAVFDRALGLYVSSLYRQPTQDERDGFSEGWTAFTEGREA